jgi:hypothetical protein
MSTRNARQLDECHYRPVASIQVSNRFKISHITGFTMGGATVEAPVDFGAGAIDAANPGAGFPAEGDEALARKQLDFGLVGPTAALGV